LWKRIPADVKEHHPEIQAVWKVGVKLFIRDLPAIYPLVDQVEWPGHLKNIMNCIKGTNISVYCHVFILKFDPLL